MSANIAIIGDGLGALASIYNTVKKLTPEAALGTKITAFGPSYGTDNEFKGPAYTSIGALNVATERMGFTNDKEAHVWLRPDGFLKWLQAKDGFATVEATVRGQLEKSTNEEERNHLKQKLELIQTLARDSEKFTDNTYNRRQLFGLYIEFGVKPLVLQKVQEKGVQLEFIASRVNAVGGDVGNRWLETTSGEKVEHFRFVLDDSGNPKPKHLKIVDSKGNELKEHSSVIQNPWVPNVPTELPIVVVGSGPSAVDHVKAQIDAGTVDGNTLQWLSPKSLIPAPHIRLPVSYKTDFLDSLLAQDTIKAQELVDRLMSVILDRKSGRLKEGWQNVMTALRSKMPDIEARMPEEEVDKFLSNWGSWYSSLRNRIDPDIFEAIQEEMKRQNIKARNGRLDYVRIEDDGSVSVVCHTTKPVATDHAPETSGPFKSEEKTIRRVGTVVNCTGPERDLTKDPLVASLIDQGVYTLRLKNRAIKLAKDKPHAEGSPDMVPVSIARVGGIENNGWQEGRTHNERCGEYVGSEINQEHQKLQDEIEQQRQKGASEEVARDRAGLKAEIQKIYRPYQSLFQNIETERAAILEQLANALTGEQEIKLKAEAEGLRQDLIDLRAEPMREVERVKPLLLKKFPNLLLEEEKFPSDPYKPGGYRKVEIFRDEEFGFVEQIFVFGPGQETVVHGHKGPCASADMEGNIANTLFAPKEGSGRRVPTVTTLRNEGDIGVVGPDVKNESGTTEDTHKLSNPAAGGLPQRGQPLPKDYQVKIAITAHTYDTFRFHGPIVEASKKGYENELETQDGPYVSVRNRFNIGGEVAGDRIEGYKVVTGLDANAPPKTVTIEPGERIPHPKPTGLIVHPDNLKQIKGLAEKTISPNL